MKYRDSKGISDAVSDALLLIECASLHPYIDHSHDVGPRVRCGRRQGLTTPRRWQQMTAALAAKENSVGKLPVSLEIVTGQAWAGAADRGVRMEDGVASFPISRIK